MEKANRRTKQHKSTKHKRLAGRSIEERPKAVERRKQFGHWEMDTVVGKRNGRESVILSLIERKTRCQLLRLIDGRDWDSVEFALREIKLEWGDCLRTITADNGPEFSTLNKPLRTQIQTSSTRIHTPHAIAAPMRPIIA
nr:IS30 family transposase [Secundilactobacillus oryzae]